MKFRTFQSVLASVALALFLGLGVYLLINQKERKHQNNAIPAIFKEYISSYSGGIQGSKDPVRIVFTQAFGRLDGAEAMVQNEWFSFHPETPGKALWIDDYTLEFLPELPFPAGQIVQVDLALSKIISSKNVPEIFSFSFKVLPLWMDVEVSHLAYQNPADLSVFNLITELSFSDIPDSTQILQFLKAKQDGVDCAISLQAKPGTPTKYLCKVKGLLRSATVFKEVELSWKTNDEDVPQKLNLRIPPMGTFGIIQARIIDDGAQAVHLAFSDPVDRTQNLEGLLELGGKEISRFLPEGSTLQIFPKDRLEGVQNLTIYKGLSASNGSKLIENSAFSLDFGGGLPTLELIQKGFIMPDQSKPYFSFRAANLKGVDITITRIYQKNLPYFFKSTDFAELNGSNGIINRYGEKRLIYTGAVIAKARIPFDFEQANELEYMKTYTLDLGNYFTQEPGALYHIQVSYKRSYCIFACQKTPKNYTRLRAWSASKEELNDLNSKWSNHSYYDDEYLSEEENEETEIFDGSEEEEDWSSPNDPCKRAFRWNLHGAEAFLFCSDVGIVAKKGNDQVLHVVLSKLLNAKPMASTRVQVFDFQNQLISEGTTDGNGFADLPIPTKPWFVMAGSGDQFGYLPLYDHKALQTSDFDVSGLTLTKGLKGFAYGERGVWRPGDTLHLSFMLEDKSGKITGGLPVKMTLRDPMGQLVSSALPSSEKNNVYVFHVPTLSEAKTGMWTASFKAAGVSFSLPIRMEMVIPNRLKLKLIPTKTAYTSHDQHFNGKISVHWLHGAIGKNLNVNASLLLKNKALSFPAFSQYSFEDQTKSFEFEEVSLFDNEKTNAMGELEYSAPIEVKNPSTVPSALEAVVKMKAFEPGGAFSTDRETFLYHPYASYVGLVQPIPPNGHYTFGYNEPIPLRVCKVGPSGEALSGKVQVEVFKANWRWWWDESEDNLNYISSQSLTYVYHSSIDVVHGKGNETFQIDNGSWGRYVIKVTDVSSGHSASSTILVGWPYDEGSSGASKLYFQSEKSSYKPGEIVKYVIPSSAGGRFLVSLETGISIVQKFWVPSKNGKTEISFQIPEGLAPTAYVSLTYLLPFKRQRDGQPVRMFGVSPIQIEDPLTRLQPVLSTRTEWKPLSKETIRVEEKNHSPMTYTLSIVDEGLLDLTRFQTPDPHAHFYSREAYGIKTWDLFDYILEAFTGKFGRALKIGGDLEKKGADKTKANRFKPVVSHLGPFYYNGKTPNEHRISIPNYTGSVRVMVVAKEQQAYGNTEKAVPVRQPVMVLATVPRVLSPGEQFDLPVSVFNQTKSKRPIQVGLQLNDLIVSTGKNLLVANVDAGSEALVRFPVKVSSSEGVGKVKVWAQSGNQKTWWECEIVIRNPNEMQILTESRFLKPGETFSTQWKSFGIKGTNEAHLEISTLPAIHLERRLSYLIHYPYGCIEQTTSSVFPQLILDQLIPLNNKQKLDIQNHVRAAIQRLQLFKTASGGFSYWPGEPESTLWGSAYAGHFLVEAQKRGYSIPSGLLEDLLKYLSTMVKAYRPAQALEMYGWDIAQSYPLYVLALAGKPEIGAMNRYNHSGKLKTLSRWQLAAAYNLSGQKRAAEELAFKAPVVVQSNPNYWYDDVYWGSDLRDNALMVETLIRLGYLEKALPTIKEIAAKLSSTSYLNTQETALSLLAMASAYQKMGKSELNGLKASCNGASIELPNSKNLTSVRLPVANQPDQPNKLSFTNTLASGVYVSFIKKGKPLYGMETAEQKGIQMEVSYLDKNKKVISPDRMVEGSTFYAVLDVRYSSGVIKPLSNGALKQIFPSGWEITNLRLNNDPSTQSDPFVYQDIRDDRVYTFFHLKDRKISRYVIPLTATYRGTWYLPAQKAGDMYDGSFSATIPGKWVQVIAQTK